MTQDTPYGYNAGMIAVLRRPVTWIAVLALLVSVAVAVSLIPRDAAARALTTVSVHDMQVALERGAVVLDVREPFEYADGHVAGTLLVPLATVGDRVGDLAKDEPVYVFCRSGNRSLAAAQTLVEAGFGDVRNVEGGILAWSAASLPVTR